MEIKTLLSAAVLLLFLTTARASTASNNSVEEPTAGPVPKAVIALRYLQLRGFETMSDEEKELGRDALEDVVDGYRRRNDGQALRELVQLRSIYLGESIERDLACVIEGKGAAIRTRLVAATKADKTPCQIHLEKMLSSASLPRPSGSDQEELMVCLTLKEYRQRLLEHTAAIDKKKTCK